MTTPGWSSQRLYRPFVRAALIVAVVLGFSTGAAILIMPLLGMDRSLTWVTHAQSHGIVQLFGWAGLFVMGLAYHVVPRFMGGTLRYPLPQRISLSLVVIGLIARFSGQSLYRTSVADPLVAAGGIILFAGMLVFGWSLLEVMRTAPRKTGSVEMWAWAGIVWSMVAGALHLVVTLRMAIDSAPLSYAPWTDALIYATLFGFITSFIFAVSIRALRGFLLLKPLHERANLASFLLLQAGLVILLIGRFADLGQDVVSTGFILCAVGLLVFVYAERILESPSGPIRRFPVGYDRYGWFVRTAYGWLILGALLLILDSLENAGITDVLPPPVSLPVMHVFTLGFVTLLIMGVGSKILPVFEGSDIRHPRLMDIAFVLVNASVLLRVGFGFSTSTLAERALGASGGVGFIGICLFAVVAFQLMTESARASYAARASTFGQVRFETSRRSRSPGRSGNDALS